MIRRKPFLALAVSALLAGCSPKGPELPAVVPVKGVIQLADGRPLKEGRLEFIPKDKGVVEADGDVKADGSFTLSSYKPNDGAVPGRYTVSISPYNYNDPSGSPRPIASRGQIPPKYLGSGSPLEVEIKSPDNVLQLKLDEH